MTCSRSLARREGIDHLGHAAGGRVIYNRLGAGQRLELDTTINYPLDVPSLYTSPRKPGQARPVQHLPQHRAADHADRSGGIGRHRRCVGPRRRHLDVFVDL